MAGVIQKDGLTMELIFKDKTGNTEVLGESDNVQELQSIASSHYQGE